MTMRLIMCAGANINVGTFNSLTAAQLSNRQCSIRESSTSANAEVWLPALRQTCNAAACVYQFHAQVVWPPAVSVDACRNAAQMRSSRHTIPASQLSPSRPTPAHHTCAVYRRAGLVFLTVASRQLGMCLADGNLSDTNLLLSCSNTCAQILARGDLQVTTCPIGQYLVDASQTTAACVVCPTGSTSPGGLQFP